MPATIPPEVTCVFGRVGLVLVVGLAIASGCGSADGGAMPGPATTAENATLPARLALSLRDHGRTIRVARSTRITLVLGSRYRWTDPTSAGKVTANAVVSDDITGAQLWKLQPRKLGLAPVRSVGTPACRPTAANCPDGPRRFLVTLDVRE
jgi:hypothetical protein